ncbi:MAG: hypothetical protein AABY22_12400 [Nanoarchaeota archaeon]
MINNTLKENLSDWTDFDTAAFLLGKSLGFFKDTSQNYKHVFWSNNKLGDRLNLMLEALVEQGFLLKQDDPDLRYKWDPECESFLDARAY